MDKYVEKIVDKMGVGGRKGVAPVRDRAPLLTRGLKIEIRDS